MMSDLNEGEQSMLDLGSFLWRGKYLIVSSTAAMVIVALFISFLMKPVYRSEGIYLYVAERSDSGILGVSGGAALGVLSAGLGRGFASSGENVQSAMIRLRSPEFLNRFVREESLLPLFFPDRWDVDKFSWRDDSEPTEWEVSEVGNDVFAIRLDTKSGLVNISASWRNPETARDLLIRFIRKANSDLRYEADERTTARLEYLTDALKTTLFSEVKVSISDLIKSEVERKMMISLEEDYAFRSVSPPIHLDPEAYVSPNKPVLVASALVFGFFAGIMIAYFQGLTSKRKALSDAESN